MNYDLIIVGAGPAGVTAGIYATRFNLKVLIVEKMNTGGQVNLTSKIDNYPAFSEIEGFELAQKLHEHAEKLGVEFLFDEVKNIKFDEKVKVVETEYSGEVTAPCVVLALGARPRKLGLINEENFTGRGVCYCAVCDGGFYKDKEVVVVGGGNSALEDAFLLKNIAKKVTLVHVLDTFQANASMIEKLKNDDKIEYFTQTEVVDICGEDKLASVKVRNTVTGEEKEIVADGLFISIGRVPNSELVKDVLTVDKNGYIEADEDMQTSIAGVYAVGDVRTKKIRQIVTACSDGAIAATNAYYFLN